MKNVILCVTLMLNIVQVRAGESPSLTAYYAEYSTPVFPYNKCKECNKLYGNDAIGYYNTIEAFCKANNAKQNIKIKHKVN